MNGTRILAGVLVLVALLGFTPGCQDFLDGGGPGDGKEETQQDPEPEPDPVPVALDLTWCVKDDASPSQMTAFAQRIQESSDALWNATHGQVYLSSVTLTDLSEDGDVILDNLDEMSAEGAFAYTLQYAGGAWEIHMGGAYPMQAWTHEMGHAVVLQDWTLEEEYDLPGAPCPVCTMDAYIVGSGEGKVVYCDAGNCTTTRNGCWETVILVTHPDWTYPRTPGPAPETAVTVIDR